MCYTCSKNATVHCYCFLNVVKVVYDCYIAKCIYIYHVKDKKGHNFVYFILKKLLKLNYEPDISSVMFLLYFKPRAPG